MRLRSRWRQNFKSATLVHSNFKISAHNHWSVCYDCAKERPQMKRILPNRNTIQKFRKHSLNMKRRWLADVRMIHDKWVTIMAKVSSAANVCLTEPKTDYIPEFQAKRDFFRPVNTNLQYKLNSAENRLHCTFIDALFFLDPAQQHNLSVFVRCL